MEIQQINNTNFQGKLIVLNNLSHKPSLCINKVKDTLQNLIKQKKFDLYIEQNYTTNKINVGVSQLNPRTMNGVLSHEELPVTAKHTRYVYAAKNAIDKHERALSDIEQKEWEQSHKREIIQVLKDMACTIIFFPLFIIGNMLDSVSPKWAKKFEKYIDKLI